MDVQSEPVAAPKNTVRPAFLTELGWFASGAILPMGSLLFYRKISQRSVGLAILFFFTFTIILTILTTITVGTSLATIAGEIHKEYQQGKIPVITIQNGIAKVDGPQPFILADEHSSSGTILIAVDTTGQISSIDRSRYSQGLLMTQTDLQILNTNGRYQTTPLSQINTLFRQDPLLINEQTVSNAWIKFEAILVIVVFIALVLWNSFVRLMFIAMIALILWAIVSVFRPKIGFGPFIICGLYAIVPAIYISHLLDRIHASFISLQTILLIFFWLIALIASLSQHKFFSLERSPRLWTAWIGLPMLIWFIVDDFIKIPSPYGEIILWALALLSGLVLIAIRLYFHLQDMKMPSDANPALSA
jgi:Protein of unknown function (DUF1189)